VIVRLVEEGEIGFHFRRGHLDFHVRILGRGSAPGQAPPIGASGPQLPP
jgi:hypothetical protein